ncbi:MAG TPA: class IV adenylate cyclase [Bacteroidota bacterium]|nr:class IV adenylate cyclase [Bacteroidota bacterium]
MRTVEIKARTGAAARLRAILGNLNAEFRGTDRQIDTYYDVPRGRLKLRDGTIEKFLIYYDRDDQPEPKQSDVLLAAVPEPADLRKILARLYPVFAVVDKSREIYFIGNVKFHLDEVAGLGSFVEIEAIDRTGDRSPDELREQCLSYMSLFGIRNEDLLAGSYSDMLACISSLGEGSRA